MISCFSGRETSLDSISETTASVLSSVEPPGMITESRKLGAWTCSGELRLSVRLMRREVKKMTRVPIIVAAGFLMLAFRTR